MSTHCRKLILPVFSLLFIASTFAGELTSRMELTLDRVLHGGPPVYTDDFVLADAVPEHVRRFTEFSGDVSGRYIGALATVAQFNGKKFSELDQVVAKILKLQKEDGHFGDPFSTNEVTKSDMAIMWGNGRLLIGLLEYYRLNPSPAVLACARRLGDYFVKVGPRYNDPAIVQKFSGDQVAVGYICWTQIIEGLVELNRITHDEKYLKLSGEIARNTHRHPKQHSHGFACALRGILELYRVTHDDQWLKKVEAEWDGIIDSGNLLPQGALPEIFKPLIARDEGCAEADWVRLNLGLWSETRNPRYLESAELSLFNEFFFNQFSTGDYGHHTFTDGGVASRSARAWWCCTFHGLRAFPDIARAAFHAELTRLQIFLLVVPEPSGLTPELFNIGRLHKQLPGGQAGDVFTFDDDGKGAVHQTMPAPFDLHLSRLVKAAQQLPVAFEANGIGSRAAPVEPGADILPAGGNQDV